MIDKEVGEIRRHLKPDRASIRRFYGYYVSDKKELLAEYEKEAAITEAQELESYLTLLKKGIGGRIGKTLHSVEFATNMVANGEEYALLKTLRDSEMGDEKARRQLVQKIINNYETDKGYMVLMAYDAYDIPFKRHDAISLTNKFIEETESVDVFQYILCAICPVQERAKDLCYSNKEKEFALTSENIVVKAPEVGMMFPAFTDRATDLYGALYYAKNKANIQDSLYVSLFCRNAPVSVEGQVEGFCTVLSTLGEEGKIEVIADVSAKISEAVELHKEEKDPEPLLMSKETLEDVLEACGVSEEATERAKATFEEVFGKDGTVAQANLARKNAIITTENITLSVDATMQKKVTLREMGGRKCLVIDIDGDAVFMNGVELH